MNIVQDMDKVLDYEYLVYHIINMFKGYHDQEDLYQVGMLGLIKALENYKDLGKAKFSTYAYKYILGEVTSFIRENKLVRVSRDIIKQKKQIDKTKDILRQKLLREPTITEISLMSEISEDKINYINKICVNPKSLDDTLDENEQISYYNSVKIYDNNMDSTIMSLNQELQKLNPIEQQIIYDKYYNGYSQSEISDILGISQAQVSRKENKVLAKLKVRL